MLNEIKDALESLQSENEETFGSVVMYGRVIDELCPKSWNYITFNRTIIRASGTSKTDYNEYFEINMVHEDFVPEDAVYEMIKIVEKIKGLKKANDDIVFNYATKKNTATVVEVATITFTHPVKGYRV